MRTNMNSLLHRFLLCWAILWVQTQSFAENVSESLVVQFSRGDLLTIERAVQDALDAAPLAGESSTPLSSPYAFGTITAKGVQYSFTTKIAETNLLDGGVRFKLSLQGFHGLIRRLELNESGSRVCANIPISSPRSDIPVAVVVHPEVASDGKVSLAVSQAMFDLNENNFEVQYPESCSVLYGFNWLVQWTLPWLIESYKDTISDALSKALSKGLSERTAEMSPLLSLNVTLPFEGREIPSFNASVSVKPSRFGITTERFLFSFDSSLEIDPDEISGLSEPASWPDSPSFFGVSWETMNAILREAQAKGIIRATFTQDHPTMGRALAHELWLNLFPRLHSVINPSDELALELLGASSFHWNATSTSPELASLEIENLRIRLRAAHLVIAEFSLRARGLFTLDSTESPVLKGVLSALELREAKVLEDSGTLSRDYNAAALAEISQAIINLLQHGPENSRKIFELKLPALRIGHHQIIINKVRTHEAGIILPLSYLRPY